MDLCKRFTYKGQSFGDGTSCIHTVTESLRSLIFFITEPLFSVFLHFIVYTLEVEALLSACTGGGGWGGMGLSSCLNGFVFPHQLPPQKNGQLSSVNGVAEQGDVNVQEENQDGQEEEVIVEDGKLSLQARLALAGHWGELEGRLHLQ